MYPSQAKSVLIIKFGAIGDVLRTTPLLTALRKQYPGVEITWLTDPGSEEVLQKNPYIDQLWVYSKETLEVLKRRSFDVAFCLDKEEEALDAIDATRAGIKRGFGRDGSGDIGPLDARSRYAVQLGIDDALKFRENKKSYQEISFEQCGLTFRGEEYVFDITEPERGYAKKVLKQIGLHAKKKNGIVGLNTGSGVRFAGKRLPRSSYVEIASRLSRFGACDVLLLGGPEEVERNSWIHKQTPEKIYDAGCHHSIRQFAGIVEACDLVITGDTLAMHMAIAMKTPVLTFFASTCSAEIELYGRGEKLVSNIDCGPCYRRDCPIEERCMSDFSTNWIVDRALHLLTQKNPL